MCKKFTSIFLCLLGLAFFNHSSAQSLQLFLEDFNAGNNYFNLNSGGPSSNSGSNQWIVNKEYDGKGIYPNTTSEHNTVGGAPITMPDSNYLHIYDAPSAPGVANDEYNNTIPSDNFTYMNGFCTLGFKDVHFSFFWLCEGSGTDYGTVYYSANYGPWIQCGAAQYNNQSIWAHEDISLPAFNNLFNLRFGFRWQNSGGGGTNNEAFGIDDVIAVGTVDNTNPVTLKITAVTPTTVCEEGTVVLNWSLSEPLCDGTYQIYLSGPTGSFSSTTNLGGLTIFAGDTSGSIQVPLPKEAGTCFKLRMDRTSPPPAITGIASTVCINMQPCPNTIVTNQAIVLMGPDTLCDQSVIDVPFISTGTFNANNVYTAELSDANGSFANPMVLGSSPDPNAYPGPPGNVSGLVGVTPPGCNYYIRVVSSSPAYTPPSSAYYGPFCIRQCDATTNQMKDVSVCIGDTTGESVPITVDINSWKKNNVNYQPGNKFIVQVLNHSNPPPYAIVNVGGLGAVVASNGTTLSLHVPGLDSLINVLGLTPGAYYIRLISSNTNSPSDTLGTLVRLTIGYANPSKPILASYDDATFDLDSVFCSGQIADILVENDDEFPPLNSKYLWKSAFNFGMPQPFLFGGGLGVSLNASTPPGRYWFQTQEINNGCLSPWSDTIWITVLTKPNAAVSGSNPLCIGDTDVFHSQFQNDTYYKWYVLGDTSRRIKTTNNIITQIFDSAGNFTIIDTIINQCGSSEASKKVTVYPKPNLLLSPDYSICLGKKALLYARTDAKSVAWFLNDTLKISTDTIDIVTPDTTGKYVVTATSKQGCKQKDSITITVNPNPVIKLTPTPVSCYGYSDGSVLAQVLKGASPYVYHWSNSADSTSLDDSVKTGSYALTVVDANTCRDSAITSVKTPSPLGISLVSTFVTYGQANGTATVTPGGGTTPYVYLWNTTPPQAGNVAVGLIPGNYDVTITDAEGCTTDARVDVTYAPNDIYLPNVFSPNKDGINDYFEFSGHNLSDIHLMIFNRWGERIFSTDNADVKWDGTYKGTPVDVGVYVYVVEATFDDGTKITKKGNVSVLR